MRAKRKPIFWLLVLILIAGAGYIFRGSIVYEFKAAMMLSWFEEFKSAKGGYKMKAPKGWIVEEASASAVFVSRVTIKPAQGGQQMGNIAEMSVTVVDKPDERQLLARQSELDDWWSKEDQEIKGTGSFKVLNEEVDGVRAVRLAEADIVEEYPDQSFWSITTWFRKDMVNYYVNMMGRGKLTDLEQDAFSKMLSSFRFL